MAQDEANRTTETPQAERLQPAAAGAFRRVSWGAVIAGSLVALTTQLVLSLLGLSIGFGLIEPGQEEGVRLGTLGTGAASWWVLSSLISLFAGGWVAGRMAGVPRRIGGALHGLVTWSLATVLTLVFLGSGIGIVVGGLLGAVGQGTEALQRAFQGEASEAGTGQQEAEATRQVLDQIVREARETLEATETPELQPEELEKRAEEARETIEDHLRAALTHPQEADEELRKAFDAVWGEVEDIAAAADKETLVNALVAETDLTREEAQQTVDRWDRSLQEARQKAMETREKWTQAARERAERAADDLAEAAFWSFLGLLLSAGCATGGGLLGAPRR